MRIRGVLWLVLLTVSSVIRLGAHHPIGSVYDEHQTVSIVGDVQRVLYQVPHPLVHVVAEDDRGRARTWAVELGAENQLTGFAVNHAALRPGDRIIVCGYPGHDPGVYRLHMLTLRRFSDGSSVASEYRQASQCESR